MTTFIEIPKSIDEQLCDVTAQIEALTHQSEQVSAHESETTINGMVKALRTKRLALLEHRQLMVDYDLSGQVVQDTFAEANA